MIYKRYVAFIVLFIFGGMIHADSDKVQIPLSKLKSFESELCRATLVAAAMQGPVKLNSEIDRLFRDMDYCLQKSELENALDSGVQKGNPKVTWELAKKYHELSPVEGSLSGVVSSAVSTGLRAAAPQAATVFLGASAGALMVGHNSTMEGSSTRGIPLQVLVAGVAGFTGGVWFGFNSKKTDDTLEDEFKLCMKNRSSHCVIQLAPRIVEKDRELFVPRIGTAKDFMKTAVTGGASTFSVYHRWNVPQSTFDSNQITPAAGAFGLGLYGGFHVGTWMQHWKLSK